MEKVTRQSSTANCQFVCLRPWIFCDLDLLTHHLENTVSLSPNCGKYLHKFLFKSIQWFSFQARKISKTAAEWPWPLNQWPWTPFHSIMNICVKFHWNFSTKNRVITWREMDVNGLITDSWPLVDDYPSAGKLHLTSIWPWPSTSDLVKVFSNSHSHDYSMWQVSLKSLLCHLD